MKNKIVHSKGYFLLYAPDHPFANAAGYIPEQRLIIEKTIGRYIDPKKEDVHHEDENVKNNAIDNLVLATKKEHRRLHNGWKKINGIWWKTCTACGMFLEVEGNFYKRKSGRYVSNCKNCIKKISAGKRPPKLSHEERSLISISGAYKGWQTRRLRKEGVRFL